MSQIIRLNRYRLGKYYRETARLLGHDVLLSPEEYTQGLSDDEIEVLLKDSGIIKREKRNISRNVSSRRKSSKQKKV